MATEIYPDTFSSKISNFVCNQRYTKYTFVPKVLINQFKFFFNVYFFLICFSQVFSVYSVSPLISNVFPWAVVLLFTLLKEGIDDFKRYKRDSEYNSEIYCVIRKLKEKKQKEVKNKIGMNRNILTPKKEVSKDFGNLSHKIVENNHADVHKICQKHTDDSENSLNDCLNKQNCFLEFIPSSQLTAGDVIFLNKNQRVPADCILLQSLENNLFVRTDQLDGETDWKLRVPILQENTVQFTKDKKYVEYDSKPNSSYQEDQINSHRNNETVERAFWDSRTSDMQHFSLKNSNNETLFVDNTEDFTKIRNNSAKTEIFAGIINSSDIENGAGIKGISGIKSVSGIENSASIKSNSDIKGIKDIPGIKNVTDIENSVAIKSGAGIKGIKGISGIKSVSGIENSAGIKSSADLYSGGFNKNIISISNKNPPVTLSSQISYYLNLFFRKKKVMVDKVAISSGLDKFKDLQRIFYNNLVVTAEEPHKDIYNFVGMLTEGKKLNTQSNKERELCSSVNSKKDKNNNSDSNSVPLGLKSDTDVTEIEVDISKLKNIEVVSTENTVSKRFNTPKKDSNDISDQIIADFDNANSQYSLEINSKKQSNKFSSTQNDPISTSFSTLNTYPISLDNTLWMNTVLASGHCLCLTTYTGKNTKAQLNTLKPRSKTALIDLELNTYSKLLFILCLLVSLFFTKMRGFGRRSDATLIKFLVILSSVVPISLKVSIDWARNIYMGILNREITVRNSNIFEDLGRIEFLLCDKTGTLTTNEMVLRKVHLGNMCFENKFEDLKRIMSEYTTETTKRLLSSSTYGKKVAKTGETRHGENLKDFEHGLKIHESNEGFNERGTIERNSKDEHNENVFFNESINKKMTHKIYDLLISLSVCHNVTPVHENGHEIYQASSPDEIAIINWLKNIGIRLVERTQDEIVIEQNFTIEKADLCMEKSVQDKLSKHDFSDNSNTAIQNKNNRSCFYEKIIISFKILHMFPFSSERKRMGVIISHNNKIEYILKGADNVIAPFLKKNDWLKEETVNFAREGLRTLVICKKEIKNYSLFRENLLKAQTCLKNRNNRVQDVLGCLETDMTLLGLTGVEDKLQRGVKSTLERLRNAGIKIWMLTGDKLETAVNIAISSKLFGKFKGYKIIEGIDSEEKAKSFIKILKAKETQLKKKDVKNSFKFKSSDSSSSFGAQNEQKHDSECSNYDHSIKISGNEQNKLNCLQRNFVNNSQLCEDEKSDIISERGCLDNSYSQRKKPYVPTFYEYSNMHRGETNTNKIKLNDYTQNCRFFDNKNIKVKILTEDANKNEEKNFKTNNSCASDYEKSYCAILQEKNLKTNDSCASDYENADCAILQEKNPKTNNYCFSDYENSDCAILDKNVQKNLFMKKGSTFGSDLLIKSNSFKNDIDEFSEYNSISSDPGNENIPKQNIIDPKKNIKGRESEKIGHLSKSNKHKSKNFSLQTKFRKNPFKKNKKPKPDFSKTPNKFSGSKNDKYSYLVIDGPSLDFFMKNYPEELISHFATLDSVVCCRCSPKNKSSIVSHLRKISTRRIAAIGDGGNDVSMITNSDVGIGIVGKEGKQASLAADFSISQFDQINSLILWHGRNCYKSTARLAHLIIHRGTIIAVMQAIFCSLFQFSPISLFQGKIIVGYVTLYTCLPVFCSILAKDTTKETTIKYPELYQDLNMKKELSFKTFAIWNVISIYQGALIMLLSFLLLETELFGIITITFSSLILNELLMVILTVKKVCKKMFISLVLSLSFYLLSFVLMPDQLVMPPKVFIFLGKVVLINVISIIFTLIEKIYSAYKPSSARKLTLR